MANELLLEWTLMGARDAASGRFMSAWAGATDMRLLAGGAFLTELELVAEGYKDVIAQQFAQAHGQSGETEASLRATLGEVTSYELQYKIEMAGNVGFVLNPLPEHVITASSRGLSDDDPVHGGAGRTENFYTSFGPAHEVGWFQGGPESHSPDLDWYKTSEGLLGAEGVALLQKVAAVVREEWNVATFEQRILAHGTAPEE